MVQMRSGNKVLGEQGRVRVEWTGLDPEDTLPELSIPLSYRIGVVSNIVFQPMAWAPLSLKPAKHPTFSVTHDLQELQAR